MLIGKRVIGEEVVEEIIKEITRKKELRNLSEEFVRDLLYTFLNSRQQAAAYLSGTPTKKQIKTPANKPTKKPTKKSAQYKSIIKQIRAQLHKFYGQYRGRADAQRLHELVERLRAGRIVDQHILRDILALNASTKERLSFYDQLYEKLFQVTGLPTTIIDLGCGLNPFSIPWLYAGGPIAKLHYYAYDINEDEIALLKEFFDCLHSAHRNFKGNVEVLDARHWEKLLRLPKADLCLLWKMTDVIDRGKGHRATEAVINSVPARWVIVSFPTKTLSGKRMNFPEKKWVELMCGRLGYQYAILKFSAEVFYLIKK